MKTTVEMTTDGEFQVQLEESTLTVFRQFGFETLPGTIIGGTGFGKTLSKARKAAEKQFSENAGLALSFYQGNLKSA